MDGDLFEPWTHDGVRVPHTLAQGGDATIRACRLRPSCQDQRDAQVLALCDEHPSLERYDLRASKGT